MTYRVPVVELLLHQRYSAHDGEGASEAMQAVFGVGVATVESLGNLRYDQRSIVDDGVSFTRIISSGALLRVLAARSPEMVVIAVRDGYMVMKQGADAVALEAGDLGVIPVDQAVSLSWEEVSMDVYSFPRSSIAHLLGSDIDGMTLRVARLRATSRALIRLWTRFSATLRDEVLQDAELFESDLVLVQAIDSLLGCAIEAFGISDAREDDSEDDGVRVERAVAHMSVHLAEPVSTPDMAHAAGVSLRGLQLAFRRTRQGNPLARLRALRMGAAREALGSRQGAQADGLVTVAKRVGYDNVGRFSAHYEQAFEESPVESVEGRPASPAPGVAAD